MKVRIVKESIPYIVIPLLLAAAAAVLGFWWVAAILLLVALFMAFFFRDPKRVPPSDPDVVVSPADGRITRIGSLVPGADSPTVISIFLSPLDVPINRSPIPAKIGAGPYSPG